jgi:hypothetical protein
MCSYGAGDCFLSGRTQVLKAPSMKATVFCAIAPCSPEEVGGRFRGAYCVNRSDDGGIKYL